MTSESRARVQVTIRVLPEIRRAVEQAAADLDRKAPWIYEQGVIALLGDRLPPHIQDLSRHWNGEIDGD
jgi:hypothetical protein